jgi:NIPSNAP
LRSYESPSEKLYLNKVQMFNEGGEIPLFDRLGFNAVFYADVINGSHMPNLMYMTSFENKSIHDDKWKAFGSDPEWKKLSALPEYQHNVSKADIILMRAADYSDIK